jgi:single-strand DNA-binding protein
MLKLTIIGNIGGDPDTRYTANGSPMLRFNVASNYRTRTPEGEYQDRTEWIRVTITGKRAETLSQYLRKGSRVYVEGRLEARPWTDQQGQIKAGLEVMANDIEFMSSREQEDGQQARPTNTVNRQPVAAGVQQQGADDSDLESLPF